MAFDHSSPVGPAATADPRFSGSGKITASIVSHGHGRMVERLVERLKEFPEIGEIILTLNVEEETCLQQDGRLTIVRNAAPKGFGENHNSAFLSCRNGFFCVLNPDISLPENPFPLLIQCLHENPDAIVAPLIVAPGGAVEDSVRYFPTPASLARKALWGDLGIYPVQPGFPPQKVNWAAGMFLLFTRETYAQLKGFDEAYFLYYEDVDICARAWFSGKRVLIQPRTRAIHEARRTSRRNLRYFLWHVRSMARYLASWFLTGRLRRIRQAQEERVSCRRVMRNGDGAGSGESIQ